MSGTGVTFGMLVREVADEAKKLWDEKVPEKYIILALLNSEFPIQPCQWWSGDDPYSSKPQVLFKPDPRFVAAAIKHLGGTAKERRAQHEFERVRTAAPPVKAVNLAEISRMAGLYPILSRQEIWAELVKAGFQVEGFEQTVDANGMDCFWHQWRDTPEIRKFINGPMAKMRSERQANAVRAGSLRPVNQVG